MKNIRAAALILFGVCAFSLPALGQTWGLNHISVTNRLNKFAQVTREHYDASGGSVEVTVDGRGLDLCSGGTEVLRFNWRFPMDVSRVSTTVSANFEAGIATLNKPCNGNIAALSSIYMTGSAGATAALPDEQMRRIDIDRFGRINNGEAMAGRNPKTGIGSIGIDTKRAPVPDCPGGYFAIWIHTRSGGEVVYVYVYERGGQPAGGNSSLPRAVRECETYQGTICGNWTLNGNQFYARWDNGAAATLTIERFDNNAVIINRRDANSDFSAIYTGRLSGNKIQDGTVTWASRGRSWSGKWNASW